MLKLKTYAADLQSRSGAWTFLFIAESLKYEPTKWGIVNGITELAQDLIYTLETRFGYGTMGRRIFLNIIKELRDIFPISKTSESNSRGLADGTSLLTDKFTMLLIFNICRHDCNELRRSRFTIRE